MADLDTQFKEDDKEMNILDLESGLHNLSAALLQMRKRKIKYEKELKILARDIPLQKKAISDKQREIAQYREVSETN